LKVTRLDLLRRPQAKVPAIICSYHIRAKKILMDDNLRKWIALGPKGAVNQL
jgi:hypothetical protein